MSRFTDLLSDLTPESTPESGFNPNAKDGDGDGIVQEGTPFERPASVKTTKKKNSSK